MISENDQNASLNAHECILFKLLKIKGVTKGYMHLLFQLDSEMSGFTPKTIRDSVRSDVWFVA